MVFFYASLIIFRSIILAVLNFTHDDHAHRDRVNGHVLLVHDHVYIVDRVDEVAALL
jgi:hypothetical protein